MRRPTLQENRAGTIECAIGPDALALVRFDGTEHVDGLFTYHVDAIASESEIDLNALVGSNLTVSLTSVDGGAQHFDGIVTQARWTGNTEGRATVRLVLEPWFALLRQRRNQRIFHEKSVSEILEEVLSSYGALGNPAYRFDLNNSYEPLEYTVQYRESELQFVLRMMERFGISYYFLHEPGSHTMVLTDAMTQFPEVEGGTREFLSNRDAFGEHFWEWNSENNMTTGAVRLTDFNFKTPTTMMEVDRSDPGSYDNANMESFDYPGKYLTPSAGNAVAALRTTQERRGDDRHRVIGDVVSMRAGHKVELGGQARDDILGQKFLCLQATHSYVAGNMESTGTTAGAGMYNGRYVMTSVDAPYAPARITPPAIVHGPQTAWVVGPQGEEIHTDEWGRIKVKFHWDFDAQHSMWCRVRQNWAGRNWGGMVIPRIGMEVIVEFLEGDPDKPLVTGCVYNDQNKPPYDLPGNKTRSTFKTNTHQGEGYNELRFEDRQGQEEIYVHAQMDMNSFVGHNRTAHAVNNSVDSIGNNQGTEIGNNFAQVVGGTMRLMIGGEDQGTITPGDANNERQGIGIVATQLNDGENDGDFNINVSRHKIQNIGQDHFETVGNDRYTETGNHLSTQVGNNWFNTVTNDFTVQAGGDINLESGGAVTISAANSITLEVGGSTIELQSSGNISVDGVKLDMKLGAMIKMAAGMIKLN